MFQHSCASQIANEVFPVVNRDSVVLQVSWIESKISFSLLEGVVVLQDAECTYFALLQFRYITIIFSPCELFEIFLRQFYGVLNPFTGLSGNIFQKVSCGPKSYNSPKRCLISSLGSSLLLLILLDLSSVDILPKLIWRLRRPC